MWPTNSEFIIARGGKFARKSYGTRMLISGHLHAVDAVLWKSGKLDLMCILPQENQVTQTRTQTPKKTVVLQITVAANNVTHNEDGQHTVNKIVPNYA